MITKKIIPAAIATGLLAGAFTVPAQAEMEISANVALVSEYRFRGISQSDEDIAIQGGFDLAFDNGIYIGTWGSSVDFDDDGSLGSLELDYYIGWSSDITENTSIDVGYLYYDYPGDDSDLEGDYQEIYGSFSWRDLTVGIHYSDDYYLESDTFFYYYANYSFALGENVSLDLHVGYNDLEEGGGFLDTDEDSYTDFSIGVTWSVAGVDLGAAYVGTTLDDDDVFGTDWGDDTFVVSIAKSM
jgi:uncharacterized protein (TIGR02001 family)